MHASALLSRTAHRTLALAAVAALAACSSDDGSAYPSAPDDGDANAAVSAEDLALEAAGGKSLTRVGAAQVVRATGDITAGLTQFRTLLGDLNPNTAGEKPAGRREVNWDGVPAAATNTDAFPGDFFNATSPRGILFTTPGTGLRVSDNNFADVNPSYALLGGFQTFSPKRTFAAVGATVVESRFVVAGSSTPARVAGFGAIFSGADRSRATKVEFLDASGKVLLTVAAPRRTTEQGFSFAGAVFDSGVIARVRITSGQAPLGPTSEDVGQLRGQNDLVIMDDFIYSEPHPAQ